MAEDKFVVVTRDGEFVPDPGIFGGKERRFYSSPREDNQEVTAAEYEQLKAYKDSEQRQLLTKKKGGDS